MLVLVLVLAAAGGALVLVVVVAAGVLPALAPSDCENAWKTASMKALTFWAAPPLREPVLPS